MNDQRLVELIQSADEVTPLPAIDRGLSQRVRRSARARARVRSLVFVAVPVAAIFSVVIWNIGHVTANRPDASVRQQTNHDPLAARRRQAADRAELARLESEAQLHDRIASAIMHDTSRFARRSVIDNDVLAALNVTASVAENRDRAAHTMLNRGDDLLRESKSPAEAAMAYRRVLALFPQASEAEAARTRLLHLGV